MKPIRILLADGHANVRKQIETRLRREEDFEIVAEATTGPQTIACALAHPPHLILIDPMMDDGTGLETVRSLVNCLPRIPIVVLTAVADTATQMELRKLGVYQILPKGIESRRLVDVLHEAATAGREVASPGRNSSTGDPGPAIQIHGGTRV